MGCLGVHRFYLFSCEEYSEALCWEWRLGPFIVVRDFLLFFTVAGGFALSAGNFF